MDALADIYDEGGESPEGAERRSSATGLSPQTEARRTAAWKEEEKPASVSPTVIGEEVEQKIFSGTVFPVVLSVPSEHLEVQWSDLLLQCAKKIS